MSSPRQRLHLVIGGHVDHGKSTVIGRLLADTGSLPDGKLDAVRELCRRTARPFEYAFLLDALKDERAQGITIDTARVFFRTSTRDCIILDAPGHIEFLRNMVTGASRAEAALLVIDAKEGIRENSRRHGFLLGMLGIRQLAVLVNKMDLVGFDHAVFADIVTEFRQFLRGIGAEPVRFIPVAAMDGDNIATASSRMPWYDGPTVLQLIEEFHPEVQPVDGPFRMPVQDVYKFTAEGDDRRIVAGTVATGRLRVNDEVVFFPSGKRSRVRAIEGFHRPVTAVTEAGEATGFTLAEQVFVARGELAARADEPRPQVTTRIRVSVFWLGHRPLSPERDYLLKLGSARVPMRVEAVHGVMDAGAGIASAAVPPRNDQGVHDGIVERHQVGDCTLQLGRALAFDLPDDVAVTGRFVIVDDYEIRGGGIVREALPDRQAWVREKVLLRNAKWEPSSIRPEQRMARHGQRPVLLLVTGAADHGAERKAVAKGLEARLFAEGRLVYFLGMASVLYGVDADLDRRREQRAEHMRRLAEVANILLDAGTILIVTAAELAREDLDLITTSVNPEQIVTVWLGEDVTTDVHCELSLRAGDEAVERLVQLLAERGTFNAETGR